MTTMDVPEVMAMPVVSTGHVAEKDMALCEADSPNNPLIAYSYEYGA